MQRAWRFPPLFFKNIFGTFPFYGTPFSQITNLTGQLFTASFMRPSMKFREALFIIAFLFYGTSSASAGSFSFTGNFNQDDDVKFFTFSIAAPATTTLQTLSFFGGVNAAGDTITGGGFVPFLHLWDAAGTDLGGVEPSTGDAVYTTLLTSAGSYIVALTENANKAFGDLPGGVLDPSQFDHFGQGNFTGPEFNPPSTGPFFAPDGSQRTSAWALDIKFVETAQIAGTVPEPGTLVLAAAGLAAFRPFARRRQASKHNPLFPI
jgi:hypothetical protein